MDPALFIPFLPILAGVAIGLTWAVSTKPPRYTLRPSGKSSTPVYVLSFIPGADAVDDDSWDDYGYEDDA